MSELHNTRSKSKQSTQNNQDEDIVYVQFSGLIDPQMLRDNCSRIKFLGIDQDNPIMQIGGNTFFQGKFDHIIGTCVFFEEKKSNISDKESTNQSQSTSQPTPSTSTSTSTSQPTPTSSTSSTPDKQNQQPTKKLSYLCKTNKTLNLQRIFLESKDKTSESR